MSCEVVRKLGSFRLTAPAAVLGHLGAISLKLPNFLTTSKDVTKGADQANFGLRCLVYIQVRFVQRQGKKRLCTYKMVLADMAEIE